MEGEIINSFVKKLLYFPGKTLKQRGIDFTVKPPPPQPFPFHSPKVTTVNRLLRLLLECSMYI